MTIANEDQILGNKDADYGRRNFVKGAALAGLAGAAAITPRLIQSASAQETQSIVEDPQKPAGLRPLAGLDCRFPVSFENSWPEGMRVLAQYFSALNRRDQQAMAQAFQFPFVTYEGIETVIVESASQFAASPPPSLNVTGKGENKLRPNSYDILDRVELLLYTPCGAGFSLDYSRFRADGHKLFTVYGIYGVTNNDGKWGIEYMSTIFRPADQLHLTFDAEAFDLRSVHDTYRDHDLGRKYDDPEQVRRSMAFPGKWGTVSIGAMATGWSTDAREGRPMNSYKIKGVKSRLHVSEITQEQIDHPATAFSNASFYEMSGQGVGKWYQSLEPNWGRVLNADMEKAHAVTGFMRYTEDGTVISEQRWMTVLPYRNRQWTAVDGPNRFGGSAYQDHTNDVRPADI